MWTAGALVMGLEPTISVVGCAANDFTLPVDSVIQLGIERKADRKAKEIFRLHKISHIVDAVFKKEGNNSNAFRRKYMKLSSWFVVGKNFFNKTPKELGYVEIDDFCLSNTS